MRRSVLLALPLAGCLFGADGYRARERALRPGPEPTTPTTESPPPCDEVVGFLDGDGDGLGGAATTWCPGEPPGVRVGGDCDDGDPAVGDVSYSDTDGDGVGGTEAPGCSGDPTPRDCDDTDPDVFPGATDWAADGVDQDCAGGDEPCGVRRVLARDDLQAAVDAACPGDEVRVDGAVPRGLPVDLTFTPDHPRAGLRLVALDPAVPVRLHVDAPAGPAVRLDDDVLEGFALSGSSSDAGGCAVVRPGRGVALRDVAFSACSAPYAGGLQADGSAGLLLERVSFVGCSATVTAGAGRILSSPDVRLEDVEVRSGVARFVGGLAIGASHAPTVLRSTFADNVGGGLAVDGGTGTLLVSECSFEGNRTAPAPDDADGVGIQIDAPVLDVRIADSSFRRNTTTRSGGAVAVLAAADVAFEDDTFEDDAAGAGVPYVGGSVSVTGAGDVVVTGGTFRRSTAWVGGALAVTASGSLAVDAAEFVEAGVYVDDVPVTVTASSFRDPPHAAIETGPDRTDVAVSDTRFTGGVDALLLGPAGDVSVVGSTFEDLAYGVVGSDASGALALADLTVTGGGPFLVLDTAGEVTLSRIGVTGSSSASALLDVAASAVDVDDLVFTDAVGDPVVGITAPRVSLARLRLPAVPAIGGPLVALESDAPSLAFSTLVNPEAHTVFWQSPGSFAELALDHVVLVGPDTLDANALVVAGGGQVVDTGASVATGDVQDDSHAVPNVTGILLDADLRLLPGSPGADVGPDGCLDLDGSPCDAGYWGGPDAPP